MNTPRAIAYNIALMQVSTPCMWKNAWGERLKELDPSKQNSDFSLSGILKDMLNKKKFFIENLYITILIQSR